MTRLLVIGGASFDVLHFEDRTIESIGGAGVYTAMAAHRSGAQVAMFSLRPEPCPEPLQPVAQRFTEWLGPVVSPDEIMRFEISYRGGKTEYLTRYLGAAEMLSPAILPADLSSYGLIHLTPFGDPEKQLAFLRACRERGAQQISCGTDPVIVITQAQTVRAIMQEADYFFMNDAEVEALFGSLENAKTEPGKVLFITLGAKGACVVQGDHATLIPAVPSTVMDPTGAGDTFCGTTIAYLMRKEHPIMAALHGVTLAAEMITQDGPAALLVDDPPPGVPMDERVQINAEQVQAVAEVISKLPEERPFLFVHQVLPPVDHPKALDYFFAATLHQFSFWSVKDNRYNLPLIEEIGGNEWKGSDYFWESYRLALEHDPEFCSVERQANLSHEELQAVFRSDDGKDVMPATELHLQQANAYGRDMFALGLTPQSVLDEALASAEPLQTFLTILDHVGGYKEDPIRKKSLLLAVILYDRPEKFFPLRDDEWIMPIADYHFMRYILRGGLVDVVDGALESKLTNRQIVTPEEEWGVRYATYLVLDDLARLSGKSPTELNAILFANTRNRCFEMTEPQCDACLVESACTKRKAFFQPVIRTTFY